MRAAFWELGIRSSSASKILRQRLCSKCSKLSAAIRAPCLYCFPHARPHGRRNVWCFMRKMKFPTCATSFLHTRLKDLNTTFALRSAFFFSNFRGYRCWNAVYYLNFGIAESASDCSPRKVMTSITLFALFGDDMRVTNTLFADQPVVDEGFAEDCKIRLWRSKR